MTLSCALLALAVTAAQSGPPTRVFYDVPYAQPEDDLRRMDVYAPATGKNLPIVVWCHGGGWTKGDKSATHRKPAAFVRKGFVFISLNYRLVPAVTAVGQARDVAQAIRRIHDTCTSWGGDPNRIALIGHSAGAHLAALVSTDGRYLKAEGLGLQVIKGCAAFDIAGYDIPARFKKAGPGLKKTLSAIFGPEPKDWKRLSPLSHVAKDRGIPTFLVVHIDVTPQKEQSERFVARLRAAGVRARMHVAAGRAHRDLDEKVGHPDDAPTKALFEFLEIVLKH